MNDIITYGVAIKSKIIDQINAAQQTIYLAMAWFTDKEIANAIILAHKRGVTIEIILSANTQNQAVTEILQANHISVHTFKTNDERGIMHHKFCLIDGYISMNGSYNYTYNASQNNVENILISDSRELYTQLFNEFEDIKQVMKRNDITNNLNIDMANTPPKSNNSFSTRLENIVYQSIDSKQIEEYYYHWGKEKSEQSKGNIDIFKTEYEYIKTKISTYATDENLNHKKDQLISNIKVAFENEKNDLEEQNKNRIEAYQKEYELEKKSILENIEHFKNEKRQLEDGEITTINKKMDLQTLEKQQIEENFIVSKFGAPGTILAIIGLVFLAAYLSIFFSSALYKTFFEGSEIRAAMEMGLNPSQPLIVDANAISKIFSTYGLRYGIFVALFFIIPIFISNLKHLNSKNKYKINSISFVVGIIIFDIIVAIFVTTNTDEIKSLLVGKESNLQIWEVLLHSEFWMMFLFGAIPLFITHYLIDYIVNSYKKSRKEIVNKEKSQKIGNLESQLIELTYKRDSIHQNIKQKEEHIEDGKQRLLNCEKVWLQKQNEVNTTYDNKLNEAKALYEEYRTSIESGKIFDKKLLAHATSLFKSGYVEYLAEYYSQNEVTKRTQEIEKIVYQTP